MGPSFERNKKLFRVINNAPLKEQRLLRPADRDFYFCRGCCKNILDGHINIPSKAHQKLFRYKTVVRKLGQSKLLSLKASKKILQTVGFFNYTYSDIEFFDWICSVKCFRSEINMDFIEKILLKESNEKEKSAVLYDGELTDEQKVVLYNEILKKQYLQKNQTYTGMFSPTVKYSISMYFELFMNTF